MARDWSRLWRHANTGTLQLRRAFPHAAVDGIERAIKEVEARQVGEIRFAAEDALPLWAVWHGVTPRERAIQKFAELRVWDTARNDGVLIYLLLADRDVEIVADRGVRVPQPEWEACCRTMEQHFGKGDFRRGALAGIAAVADALARHPRAGPDAGNELPDRPLLL